MTSLQVFSITWPLCIIVGELGVIAIFLLRVAKAIEQRQ